MLKTIKNLIAEGTIKPGKMLDLGSGKGADAIFATESGFIVTAVDKNEVLEKNDSITYVHKLIEKFEIKKDEYDVIFADNAFPFLSYENAKKVISNAADRLKSGGVLYFSLFGEDDGWVENKNMSFWKRADAEEFIKTLPHQLYRKVEEEGFAPQMNGEVKYWHILRYILKKQ